jgi:hypothetical protein
MSSSGGGLRILLTNLTLADWTGTEAYVRDLAAGLLRRGHQPVVYSPRLGEPAEEIRRASVPVVDDLDAVGAPPDLIHGHHNLTAMTALLHFPGAACVFVCHGQLAWHDAPPLHPRIRRYVGVDDNCRDRLLLAGGLPEERVRVVLNWVDLERFRPRPPLPETPRRALVFSNYVDPAQLRALRAACDEAGLALDVLGARAANTTARPEDVLPEYDLVFAKGRSALEALAVGAAVVLLGVERMGPLVASADFDRLRRWNFGTRAIQGPVDPERVLREIRRYDAQDAARVSERLRREASFETALDALLGVYAEALEEHGREAAPGPDLERRATARFLATLNGFAAGMVDQVATIERLRRELRRAAALREPMSPLADEDCARLALQVQELPARAEAGETFELAARVRNGSGRLLCSAPPHPMHLACRWTDAHDEARFDGDGPRTRLEPPLLPDSDGTYAVAVRAPSEPGLYRLRVTLVQEDLRWLDSLGDARLWREGLVMVA